MSQRQYQSAPASFKPPGTHHTNPAAPFPNESSIWEAYVNEAVVVDNELVKDWASSLNFLLVFAAIFSSVLSAFIIESKQMLEQDPANVMVDALIFFINNTANGTHTPYSTPAFSAPSYAVSVNCLFFTSLSASILAALASVVSLQWIAEYDAAVSRSGSSPEDRTKRRQFRYGGMEKWKMKEIIAALPILLYCSLVLFFVGVAQWMWGVHKTVGGVVLGGILLGGSFYFITTLVAVVFPSCPYRAPIVRWIYISFHFLFRSFSCSSHSQKSGPKGGVAVAPKFLPFTQVILTKLDYIRKAASNVPGYITTFPDRFRNLNIQERDQDYIISDDKSLINDSLAWLAQNISISRDSHHRLLLLAQEASKLDAEQQTSKQFKQIPWSEIFRLLGNKRLDDITSMFTESEDWTIYCSETSRGVQRIDM
ncbi:hypothetical protein CPB86DRAFT_498164 [Serendipita vermifera]|nr:hypothetical protein CPB86DRAFT_498164 [Serendipita vermifera]